MRARNGAHSYQRARASDNRGLGPTFGMGVQAPHLVSRFEAFDSYARRIGTYGLTSAVVGTNGHGAQVSLRVCS